MNNIFSAENLKRGIEMSKKMKNQFGEPFTIQLFGKDNVYKVKCPHCKEQLQFPAIMPKMICYKCDKVIDNLLTIEDLEDK